MHSQKKAGAILGYLNIGAKNLVNLIYVPLLLHFLGQGDYGVYQMTASVTFALTLLEAGFSGAYVRFYMRKNAKDDEAGIRELNGIFFLTYLAVALLCLVGGAVLVANVQRLFSGGLTASELVLARQLMAIMSVNIAVQFLSSPFDSYIAAHEQFIFQQSRQLLVTIVQPFLAVLLLMLGLGAVGVASAQFVVTVVLLLLNISFSLRKLGMRFTFRGLEGSLFKAILVFSFWIFLNQIFDLVNNNVPNFLLGAMASSSAVAVFSIAMQIRNIFVSMSTTMSNVFVPQINRMVAESDDNTELTHLMTRVGRYQMILFWYIYGGFIVLGRFFVHIWAGDANADAYWLTVMMVLPVMIPLTQNTGIEIQRAKNRHKTRSLIYILTSVINIVISVLLIPRIGYWATAIGYVVGTSLGTGLFMNWYYQTRIGLDMFYFWRNMFPTIALAVGVTAVCLAGSALFPVDSFPSFILWGGFYSLLFGGLTWKISLTDVERNNVIRRIARKG
ncbi:MAG: lipopolysaccharide biosynthesis protein [Bifidobacteriaceae bacterium]|nr:lipopolysaccharide biosynthesis protein [Bifidobacteriaceae bacterium]